MRSKRYTNPHAKAIRQRANRKLGAEYARARARAKYGPSEQPAPVVVRRVDGR
jgi:hypothetical protein